MRRILGVCSLSLAVSLCAFACVCSAVAADSLNAIIQAMPADSWYEIPNSKLNEDPAEVQDPERTGVWQGHDPGAHGVFSYSGGAFDSKRDRLLIWGGGHHAYYGNEVYAFNLEDFTWERLTDPSPTLDAGTDEKPGPRADILSDGNPNSRHTYFNLDYIPEPFDAMFSSPAGATAARGCGLDRHTWLFDLKTNKWINKGKTGVGQPIVGESPTASAYDPVSKLVYSVGAGGLYEYNLEKNFWRRLDNKNINDAGAATDRGMTIDTKRNKIVVVGQGEVAVYDLDGENAYKKQSWKTKGNEFQNVMRFRPGVNYDPILDRIVIWHGGAVQALNMDTKEWTAMAVAPQKPYPVGTYGRFRYSPKQNAYVVANDGRRNVLIYKATAGAKASPER